MSPPAQNEEQPIWARDVMVRKVVTVNLEIDIAEAVKLLVEHDISTLPVLDQGGKLVGIISEADLMERIEIGTERRQVTLDPKR